MTKSDLESQLSLHILSLGLPRPEQEYRFHPDRRWRFDFAWPEYMIAVEVEGGTWTRGRHTRGAGFERDCEKYNAAAVRGWTVLRYTSGMIESGEAVGQIKQAIRGKAKT